MLRRDVFSVLKRAVEAITFLQAFFWLGALVLAIVADAADWFAAIPEPWGVVVILAGWLLMGLVYLLAVGTWRAWRAGELSWSPPEEQPRRDDVGDRVAAAKRELVEMCRLIPIGKREDTESVSALLSVLASMSNTWAVDPENWRRRIRSRLIALVSRDVVNDYDACLRTKTPEESAREFLRTLSRHLSPSDLRGSDGDSSSE